MQNQIIPACEHPDTYSRGKSEYCRKCGKIIPCAVCSRYIPEVEATAEIYYDDMKLTLEHPVCRNCESLYVTRMFLRLLLHMSIWPKGDTPTDNIFLLQELLETAITNIGEIPHTDYVLNSGESK